jgi:hypothetical protein
VCPNRTNSRPCTPESGSTGAAFRRAAEPLGFAVDVLSDATGAIDLANDAGIAPARQVHETLMALLHSNWAAVTDTATWTTALHTRQTLAKSDLITSAAHGRSTR